MIYCRLFYYCIPIITSLYDARLSRNMIICCLKRRDHVLNNDHSKQSSTLTFNIFPQSEFLAEIRCSQLATADSVIRVSGMHKRVRSILAAFILLYSAAAELASRNSSYPPHIGKRMQGGLHLPLSRRLIPKRITLGADTGVAGLGDFFDV